MDRKNELHYKGVVDPAIGTPMGPDMLGRVWIVNGVVYDPVADVTTVFFDEHQQ